MNPRTLNVRLDPAPVADRLVLRRWESLPANERQSWLRRLLIAGLLEELRPEGERARARPLPVVTVISDVSSPMGDFARPFAHLAGVI